MTKGSLWIYRPLLNGLDLLRWAIEQGVNRMVEPDNLHVTLATARSPQTEWSLAGDPLTDTIEILEGDSELISLGTKAWCLGFDNAQLQERNFQIKKVMKVDYASRYRPHITLARGGGWHQPRRGYRGKLIFGPEVYEPFIAQTLPTGGYINRNKYRAMVGLPDIDEDAQILAERKAGRAANPIPDHKRARQAKWRPEVGDLDSPAPNHFDQDKRGFQPQ